MIRKSGASITAAASMALVAAFSFAAPSVYPTGTTIYDPEAAFSGYTVLSPLGEQAAIVIDMNGRVVKEWEGFNNSAGGPARILPGGQVMSANGARPGRQESLELVQRDFEGNIVWQFNRNEQIEMPDGSMAWSARQHHDWQRSDFPAGYYSPGAIPGEGARTLFLSHTNHEAPAIADATLEDERIIEVSWDGEITWEWIASEHYDELGFSEAAKSAIRSSATPRRPFDWLHLNSATYLGPNHWFDAGDERFDPQNIIVSSRTASLLAIISRDDGSIVWRMGPDFSESPELLAIRQIIGPHHPHIIPERLPGAGNVLVFDNGGSSGFGTPSPIAPRGVNVYARSNSRILEIDPVSLELVWSYAAGPAFFSTNISGAQRLPNGNTLIAEGANGRLFEVTAEGDIVWEYIHPVYSGARGSNAVYRAYRLPYDWIPQLDPPQEQAVVPPSRSEFRVP